MRFRVFGFERKPDLDDARWRLGCDTGQEAALRPAGVADRAVVVVDQRRRAVEDALLAQRLKPVNSGTFIEAVERDRRVEEFLAQTVDVWRAGSKLVHERQGEGVVGLDPPGEAVNDRLSLRPDLAEARVHRSRRSPRIAVCPLGKAPRVVAPEVAERIIGADAERIADRVDLLAAGVLGSALWPTAIGDDRAENRAKHEVALPQQMADDVRRRLNAVVAVHQTTGVADERRRLAADEQEQSVGLTRARVGR